MITINWPGGAGVSTLVPWGSVAIGGALALVEPLVNTVAYFFHEKLWERLRAAA